MLSTCPSCLAQVNHADHLFDVTCECGNHFSPFLNVENSGGYEAPPESKPQEFNESANAFQDIVNFGETLSAEDMDKPMEPLAMGAPAPETPKSQKTPPPIPQGGAGGSFDGVTLTSQDVLSDQQITNYFPPISTIQDLDTSLTNPMQPAFQALSAQAQNLGANAVVGLTIALTGDGTKVLLMGTPVRCVKIQ